MFGQSQFGHCQLVRGGWRHHRQCHQRRIWYRKLLGSITHTMLVTRVNRHVIPMPQWSHMSTSSSSCGNGGKPPEEVSYSSSLNLPKTDFTMRANASQREPSLYEKCGRGVYDWQLRERRDHRPVFVLHDGPPYANGRLHMGHAMNKILKDIINRYKMIRGFHVRYVPGWDCHGLPIELKALEAHAVLTESGRLDATGVGIRDVAQRFAADTIKQQKREFVRMGIMGEWDESYSTMDPEYEAAQLSVFETMLERGLIVRGLKPVHWSPSSQTALAEAELQYEDNHKSDAVFVAFRVVRPSHVLAKMAVSDCCGNDIEAVIWTTTPWTLPANKAVCYSNDLSYVVVHDRQLDRYFLVAEERLAHFGEQCGRMLHMVGQAMSGRDLAGSVCVHPFRAGQDAPMLSGDHVTTETGTGLVHIAPGHGVEDFHVCANHGIGVLCPVDGSGRFTAEAGEKLVGKHVLENGNAAVLDLLREQERHPLLHHSEYRHRYPYDWRTKKPVIFRATEQWFARLDTVKDDALRALDDVHMVPDTGRARLRAMVGSRLEWCISRQRLWGVPIPAFYHRSTGQTLMTVDTVRHFRDLVARHGTDCWWTMSTAELLPREYESQAREYERGQDTMDVWFDSGTSWRAVLAQRGLDVPCDVVLEGSDQHRGWFQSSLLTSVSVGRTAPCRTIITHGFVLDLNNRKMSKSLGNLVEPSFIIHGISTTDAELQRLDESQQRDTSEPVLTPDESDSGKKKKRRRRRRKTVDSKSKIRRGTAYGADVLRLWVSSTDYSKDVTMGDSVIQTVSQLLRKLRVTARFMLGCVHDMHASRDMVPLQELQPVDQFMLHRLHGFSLAITQAYEDFNFRSVFDTCVNFATNDLSAFYFEISKDRLYADATDSHSRRSCQTVLVHCLHALTKALAPIVCHTAEDIYAHVPAPLKDAFCVSVGEQQTVSSFDSVFAQGWMSLAPEFRNDELATKWNALRQFRDEVYRAVEILRQRKVASTSMKVDVLVESAPPKLLEFLQSVQGCRDQMTLSDLLIVARVSLCVPHDRGADIDEDDGEAVHRTNMHDLDGSMHLLSVRVKVSDQRKCPRCWNFRVEATQEDAHVCTRCASVLHTQGHAIQC